MVKRKRAREVYAKLGTVSEGTLRTEDLLYTFLDVAEGLRLTRRERDEEIRPVAARMRKEYSPGCLPEGETAEEAMETDLDAVREVLEAHAPPFCYFGTLEGDGAHFGFWVSHESLSEAEYEGEVWREDDLGSCPVCGERVRPIGRVTTNGREVLSCGDASNGWEAGGMPKGASYRLVVSDHGNMSLYTRRGREVWGVV